MIRRTEFVRDTRVRFRLSGLAKWLGIAVLALALTACEVNEESVGDSQPADPAAPPGGGNPPPPTPPPPTPPPPPPPPPSDTDQQRFEATLYPHLTDANNFCVNCHGVSQDPLFAVSDAATAYNAITSQQKVNLTNPPLSRVYVRPADERHNCGGDASCDRIAADFLAAIQEWATQAAADTPPPSGGGGPVLSAAVTFSDAVAGGPARMDDAAIALFTFSEGSGDMTMDTSGVGAPIALQITDMEWVEGGGLRSVAGKAEASAADSRKLFDLITPANEFTVEAWLLPDNTVQDGPARIVSYSQDTAIRNFTMGQNAIYYQLRNSSGTTDAGGTPALEALDPEVTTELTHVAMTFDAVTGRRIFINGQLAIEEGVADDTLAWRDDQLLVIGNEVTNDRPWAGVVRLVAIHDKSLTDVEIQQNFDAGAGDLVTMRFDVSDAVGQMAYVEMQVAQLDVSGYLFAQPVFVSDATGVAVKNIRIGVNGGIPVAAQPFRRIDTVVQQSGALLSPLGAVVPVELGADGDIFHLEFELLGNMQGVAETTPPSSPPLPVPDVAEPELGMRTFSELNDTMSDLTGIDPNQNEVLASYSNLRDSLPATPNLLAFVPAQQIAIQQLATSYCGAVVADSARCDAMFGNCAIDGNAKDQVATALYDRMIGDNLAVQPDRADVTAEVVSMIDDLGCANGCNAADAQLVLQASCAAVLSSAAVTVN